MVLVHHRLPIEAEKSSVNSSEVVILGTAVPLRFAARGWDGGDYTFESCCGEFPGFLKCHGDGSWRVEFYAYFIFPNVWLVG